MIVRKPKFGHSQKKWPWMNKGRRTVTCFVSEEEYRELENMRDEMNKSYLEEDYFVSVSYLGYMAIQFFLEEMEEKR